MVAHSSVVLRLNDLSAETQKRPQEASDGTPIVTSQLALVLIY